MPTTDLIIRSYRADDLTATVDLWHRSWAATFPDVQHKLPRDQWDVRFVEKIIPANEIWIAERGARIAGFLAVDPGTGHLDQLFIEPTDQNRGVGSALMEKAKALSPDGLHLRVLRANTVAIRFYERHGFAFATSGISPYNKMPMHEYVWTP
ncbi:MAG: GNAT family N-acetyltransferase [Alphaproteobacteria bacterium]|nr:GNAT family N-acetyltransferase [Alphaproteobacteria bacterium]